MTIDEFMTRFRLTKNEEYQLRRYLLFLRFEAAYHLIMR